MRKYPELNKVGLFRKLRSEGFLVQHYAGGKPYLKGSIIHRSSLLNPIYSFGNNYAKHDIDFSLFIWTDENDIAKITKFFDEVVKGLTKEQVKNIGGDERYTYLDMQYKGAN